MTTFLIIYTVIALAAMIALQVFAVKTVYKTSNPQEKIGIFFINVGVAIFWFPFIIYVLIRALLGYE